jgi:uncharacterized membrane protein
VHGRLGLSSATHVHLPLDVSLLVWVYFTEGVMRAWSEPGVGRLFAGVEILLCLMLFAACGLHVRQRLGWGRKKKDG